MASKILMIVSKGNAFGKELCSKASSSMIPTGCKAIRAARTDTSSPSLIRMMSFNLKGAPDDFLDSKLRASLTFPWNIILLNAREIDSGDSLGDVPGCTSPLLVGLQCHLSSVFLDVSLDTARDLWLCLSLSVSGGAEPTSGRRP